MSANNRIVIPVGVGFAVYDLDNEKLIATVDLGTYDYRHLRKFAISPNGNVVYFAGQYTLGAHSILNLKTGDEIDVAEFELIDETPAFDHESKVFAIGGPYAGIWDLRSRTCLYLLPPDKFPRVAFNHDGSMLAIAGFSVAVLIAKPKVVGPARWKRLEMRSIRIPPPNQGSQA